MNEQFEKAVSARGTAYLEAESILRAGGTEAMEVLEAHVRDADPVARLIAQTLRRWVAGAAPENDQLIQYFDWVHRKLQTSIISTIRPEAAALYLQEHFEGRAVDFVTLRLVKSTDWPRWQALGVILYLRDQKAFSSTPALIRFAIETNNAEYRKGAMDALQAMKDPELPEKLAAERMRLETAGKEMPPVFRLLEKEPR